MRALRIQNTKNKEEYVTTCLSLVLSLWLHLYPKDPPGGGSPFF
jgi:hypothetical protein